MTRPVLLLTALGMLLAVGCDENDDSLLTSEITYTYADLAIFVTSEYLFSKRDYIGSLNKIPEPLVNWEQSFGEPFFDVNGDGVYDPAVDSFVISADPNFNQDLNGNGYYDSPDSAWSEGIPFDDIDSDGTFDPDSGNHTTGYQPGLPYADFNLNHIHDGDLKAVYGIQRWSSGPWNDGSTAYYLTAREEAVYRFVSDSNLVYDLRFWFQSTMNALIPKSDALYYRFNQYLVPILPNGVQVEESGRKLVISDAQGSITFDRSITFNVALIVDNVSYLKLLEVTLENETEQYLFYFMRGVGLFAYIYRQDRSPMPGTWTDYYQAGEYYLRRYSVSHPLVFPTTR